MELHGSQYLISHTFQRKRYISIAHTREFIMYALGPFRGNNPIYNCMKLSSI